MHREPTPETADPRWVARLARCTLALALGLALLPAARAAAQPAAAAKPAPAPSAPRAVAEDDDEVQPVAASTPQPASQPASQPARPAGDPFARLRVLTPRSRLAPLRSVRVRNPSETRAGQIKILIKTSPAKASVLHGGRALGETPLTLTAERHSTPMDIVIRRSGYMILRTRIMRQISRTYDFKLTPAKVH